MTRILILPVLSAGLAVTAAAGPVLTPDCRQLIVGLARSWEDTTAALSRWERPANGSWTPAGAPWPARLGKNGSAWGLGEHPTGLPGPAKTEGDGRAPAGLFRLGNAYGTVPDPERQAGLAYHLVGPNDLWVEDPGSADYNRHRVLPHTPRTPWELNQQMRQDDPAHALKLFIAHNAPPRAVAGAGSAIFFHIWREAGGRPSTGCTVMAEAVLRRLIAWVDPSAQPRYVLLPRPVYEEVREAWGLPQVP